MARTGRQIYEALGKKAKATSLTFFKQADWLSEFPEWDREGKCYGLSVAYLIAMRVGLTGADYIGTLDKAAGYKDSGIYKEVSGGTGGTEGDGVGTNFFGLQYSTQSRNQEFQAAHMAFVDEKRFKSPGSSFAQHISNPAPMFSMLQTPNHAMAAACMPDDERWTFFDPNVGEAVLPTQSHFKTFVAGFFSANEVVSGYKRKTVSQFASEDTLKRQTEEAKNLYATAVRFRPTVSTFGAG